MGARGINGMTVAEIHEAVERAFPFGPILTLYTLVGNFGGGNDVTAQMLSRMPLLPTGPVKMWGARPRRQDTDPANPAADLIGADSAAGWYRDPTGRHHHRWWDGSRWTDRAASNGVEVTDAP